MCDPLGPNVQKSMVIVQVIPFKRNSNAILNRGFFGLGDNGTVDELFFKGEFSELSPSSSSWNIDRNTCSQL